jgi:iron complex transport system permease protein
MQNLLPALSPSIKLSILAALSLILAVLLLGMHPDTLNDYILNRRLLMVVTMVVVSIANGLATLIFQTITNNRILSPSVMGFESLFVLIQTGLVFFCNVEQLTAIPPLLLFLVQVTLMVMLTVSLYRQLLLGKRQQGLYLLVLTGIVCGTLFSGGATLLQRLLSPTDFAIVQSRLFARFTLVEPQLLLISAIVTILVAYWLWRKRHVLDVLALGASSATLLGINWQREVYQLLSITSLLVAIATALIGPLAFFGFLAVTLSYQGMKTHQHQWLMPATILIGLVTLCGGQLILQYGLDMAGSLSVVIEFVGGFLFLVVLLKYKTI